MWRGRTEQGKLDMTKPGLHKKKGNMNMTQNLTFYYVEAKERQQWKKRQSWSDELIDEHKTLFVKSKNKTTNIIFKK